MKAILQLATSLVALGAVLAGSATAATPIAELPLKMSVLAKPNVIFGMDDSGSMDSELMLYNNDGAFWWNATASTGWGVDAAHPNPSLRTITSTWFNSVGTADATWRKMVYLFPNGTGLGNRVYADAANDHFAIMPTRQFAFLRWSGVYKDSEGVYRKPPSDPASSPVHNPLYYNPLITYEPWAPAYISTGAVTPAAATPNAVKSHPMYGTVTFDLTAVRGASTTADNVFTALPGMRVPAGSRKMVCNNNNASCGAWTNVTADENAAASSVTRVSMQYWPATYWVKETCTPENTSQVTDTCTTAPDGSTLKRYEIRSTVTSYPGGRTYTAELQNFSNWFQYYRKRKMMLAGAMGDTMETLTGMRLGVIPFNSLSGNVTMYDSDATSKAVNRARVAGIFYEANGSGGTPTRETLKYIGEQFKRTDATGTAYNMIQYGCQRNNAFIVTDGFANASAVTMPGWDSGKSESTYGSGAPYANIYAGSLADLALRYYTNNPRPPTATGGLAAGVLPANSVDTNTNLHMNTYGLTLGARGTMFFSETSPRPTSTSAWPDPATNRSPTSVDDLWHATINGRGKMYLATTPEETAYSIRAGLEDILSQKATQGGVSVNTVNLVRGDSRAYLGSYNPSGWTGDLEAVNIDVVTGDLGTTRLWSAATLLAARPWTDRVIATWGGSGGVSFSDSLSSVTNVVNPSGTYGTNTEVMAYLRGDRSKEGTLFRTRKSLIGAVINAEPVVDRDTGVVYIASGEGMLHAVDTQGSAAGKELWAYVPGQVLTDIGEATSRTYTFRTKLDGTPVIRKIDTTTKLLVAGMGAAGRGYYAIDVTSPRGIDESTLASKVKWEFPSASETTMVSKVGQTLGRPSIVRLASGTTVVLVTSGYNNTFDGKGRVWMLNATTGAVIKEFVTSEGSLSAEVGLAHVAPFAEADGSVRYVYGGDLLGNVWRVDLEASASSGMTKIAQLRGPTGVAQPVTTPPELMYFKGNRIVYIGTGRLLDIGDFGVSDVQSVYAIADGSYLSNARTSLVQQVYTAGSKGAMTSNPVDWTTQRGWYVDLPGGEQVNTRPVIAYGGLAFVTNKAGSADCSASARMYIIDVLNGGKFIGADFVSTTISDTSNASAVAAILTKDGKKVKGISREYNSGNPVPKDLTAGIPIPPMKNSWTEIRR